MSEKQTFSVGDRIEHTCIACGEDCGHIVSSLGKRGQITRITCPMCGSRVAYKADSSAPKDLSDGKTSIPYDQSRAYRKGETVTHQMFGAGRVTAVIQPHKMDVLFADRMRRLVCGNN
jgi:DNA-directed RNA polymerase subunit RPC12/RpoP